MRKGLTSDVMIYIGERLRSELGILNHKIVTLYRIQGKDYEACNPIPVMDEVRRIEQKIDAIAEHLGLVFDKQAAQPEKVVVKKREDI